MVVASIPCDSVLSLDSRRGRCNPHFQLRLKWKVLGSVIIVASVSRAGNEPPTRLQIELYTSHRVCMLRSRNRRPATFAK
jgi:hypothetical protein